MGAFSRFCRVRRHAPFVLPSAFALSLALVAGGANAQVFGGNWIGMEETPAVLAQKLAIVNREIPDTRAAIDRLRARIDAGEHVKPFTNRWGENVTPKGDGDLAYLKNLEDDLEQLLIERRRLQSVMGTNAGSPGTTLTGERPPAGARPASEPTGAVRAQGEAPNTQAVRPGAGAAGEAEASAAGRAAGSAAGEAEASAAGRAAGTAAGEAEAAAAGRAARGSLAAGAAIGFATAGVDYYICRQEGKSHAQCLVETGAGALIGTAVGAGVAAGIALLPPAAAAAAIGTLGGVAINMTANRLAGAPAQAAEREFQAELERRFKDLFPKLSAGVETKVAEVERLRRELEAARQAPHNAAVEANQFSNAANANFATLQGELAGAGSFCGVPQALADIESDFGKRVDMLEQGLNAAAGMVATCANRSDVAWAKELYQTGLGVAAEMVVKSQQAEKAQAALQATRAAADSVIAAGQSRAEMIAGNADVASSSSSAAIRAALVADSKTGEFRGDLASTQGLVASFSSWFPPRPEVQAAVAGWNGRLAAAAAGSQEATGALDADVASAVSAATNAGSRRDRARALVAEAKAKIDACTQQAEAAANAALAAAVAGTAAAARILEKNSNLPQEADVCIAKLDAPPVRSLVALHVRCPERAFVGDLVTCTAVGVYTDNMTKAEDLTQGPWDVGPVFTSQTAGPVSVRVARENLSDAATVVFEERPVASNNPPKAPPAYNPFDDPNLKPPQKPTQVAGNNPASTRANVPPPPPDNAGAPGAPPRQLGAGGQPIPGTYSGEKPPGAAPQTNAGTGAATMCWSDQFQSYVPSNGYPCPPALTPPRPLSPFGAGPLGAPVPPRQPPRSPVGPLAGTAGIGVVTAPGAPATPPGSQAGGNAGGAGTGGGGSKTGVTPPAVAQAPATPAKPAAGGQCSAPLCREMAEVNCNRTNTIGFVRNCADVTATLPSCFALAPGQKASEAQMKTLTPEKVQLACYNNMLQRCQQGEAGGTGEWCVRKGADPSCEVRAQRVCG